MHGLAPVLRLVFTLLALLAVACGDDDSDSDGGNGGGGASGGADSEPARDQTDDVSELLGESTSNVGETPSELADLLNELSFDQESTTAEPAALVSDNTSGDATAAATAGYIEATVRHADTVWSNWFTSHAYQEPQVGSQIIMPGAEFTSRCQLPDGTNTLDSAYPNAVYCSQDPNQWDFGVVILPVDTFTEMWTGNIFQRQVSSLKRVGDFAAGIVVAHEFGHHVQDELTEQTGAPPPPNPNRELIADCFAGVWAYAVYLDSYLEVGDIEEAMNALEVIGDELGSHGTGPQRQNAFLIGYTGTTDLPGGGVPDRCVENYWSSG